MVFWLLSLIYGILWIQWRKEAIWHSREIIVDFLKKIDFDLSFGKLTHQATRVVVGAIMLPCSFGEKNNDIQEHIFWTYSILIDELPYVFSITLLNFIFNDDEVI